MNRIQLHFHTELFRQLPQLMTARARMAITKPNQPLRILSFGSSIGEEIATLRYLFPEAEIHGCDADEKVLAICKRSVGTLANIFFSSPDAIAAAGPFDIILASAVLCLHPTPSDFKDRFPPQRFDDFVSMLDDNLSVGGLLLITNASYRFTECPLAARYDTVRSDIVNSAGFVDVFSRDLSPYLKRLQSSGGHIYNRLGSFVPRDDEDLADCIFEKRADATEPAIHTLRLAPPPAGLRSLHRHTRLSTDWASKAVPDSTIVVRFDYDLCQMEDNGTYGYVQTISWGSLVGEGVHTRPATWMEIS